MWDKLRGKIWGNTIDQIDQPVADPVYIRDGNNVPGYMMKTEKQKTGVFFGVKQVPQQTAKSHDNNEFVYETYYVGKPQDRDGHVLIIGGAGSGKSSCIAIPTLETWGGTIFAIDIKGELTEHWKNLPNPTRNAKIFSFSKGEQGVSGYDPFYFLSDEKYKDDLVQNAREIAQSIIQIPPNTLEPFWLQAAQNVLTASILYGYGKGESFNWTLEFIQSFPLWKVIEIIGNSGNSKAKLHINQFLGSDGIISSLEALVGVEIDNLDLSELQPATIDMSGMADSKLLAGISAELSNRIMPFATDQRIKASFASVKDKLNADGEPVVDAATGEVLDNTVKWEDLETQNVFMRIAEDKLGQWDGAITLMLTQLIRTLERRKDIYGPNGKDTSLPPVLLLLDEFPRLGKVDVIQNAVSTLRSKGVTICLMMQSLAQLDKAYGVESRRIIVDNCQYKALLNITDPENQKVFSEMIGSFKATTKGYTEGHGESRGDDDILSSNNSHTLSESREPVFYPHDFASLDDDMILIVPKGFCRVYKAPWYDPEQNFIKIFSNEKCVEDENYDNFVMPRPDPAKAESEEKHRKLMKDPAFWGDIPNLKE